MEIIADSLLTGAQQATARALAIGSRSSPCAKAG
jgi:hypothetical protein